MVKMSLRLTIKHFTFVAYKNTKIIIAEFYYCSILCGRSSPYKQIKPK